MILFTTRFLIKNVKLSSYVHNCKKFSSWENVNLGDIPQERIRNFSIIAHVDHGKSTLCDRFLEITGAISKNDKNQQVLDNLQVEKQRGITVKAQSVSLLYPYKDNQYLLNLIDTPGHVDFSNEVARSLSICDGVVLLVDACQGVQAQTVANFYLAKTKNLVVIPVINKIDIKHANPDRVLKELEALFKIDITDVAKISAKFGLGVEKVLDQVIEKIPPPNVNKNENFRGLVFDSWYDRYKGTLNLTFVHDGQVKTGDEIQSYSSDKVYPVRSISILKPQEMVVDKLDAGQVGLISCNMRNSNEITIGETIFLRGEKCKITPFEKFKSLQPMVFAGIYPSDQSKHVALRTAIDKLILNDSGVTVTNESSPALGQGWRLGFLGLLHMEVFCQRLEQEYDADPIITAPSVTYKLKLRHKKLIKQYGKEIIEISNAALFPDEINVSEYFEPLVKGTVITPTEFVGKIISLCVECRGVQEKSINLDNDRILMTYVLPLSEIILDFNDKLKTLSSGYASFNYENYGYHTTNIVKLEVHLNGKPMEEFSRIVHTTKALTIAKEMVIKLKELIPRQMVQIAIQICVGSKVLARETIKPYRKDVTAKLYGGDVTRRKKLLAQQAEGKKKMRLVANIRVPHEAFIKILKR